MQGFYEPLDDAVLKPLFAQFPCRDHQIRSLAALSQPNGIPCRNLVIHGSEATGKTAITQAVLLRVSEHYRETTPDSPSLSIAKVDAAQCITTRHLFERILDSVASKVSGEDTGRRKCETMAQLAVSISDMLKPRQPNSRFVLVLDGIDRLKDAPATVIPALGRLPEMIPCLTCIFIVTSPPASFLRTASSIDLHFPPYTKPDYVEILALSPPEPIKGTTQKETNDLWTRFCGAVYDALIKAASRSLYSYIDSCNALWPRFTAPIINGTYEPKEFSKLLVAARVHFQDETLLNPSIISAPAPKDDNRPSKPAFGTAAPFTDLSNLLPTTARLLLLSAYLASHNAAKFDLTVFSTYHHGKKRRRGGGTVMRRNTATKHRKIAKKLLGLHAFVFERMMAIFESVRLEWADNIGSAGVDGDVGMALITLTSLRLVIKVGAGDVTDRSGKWRINVGWDAIRSIGRSIGVDVEEWLVE